MKIFATAASALTFAALLAGTSSPAEAFGSRGACYNHVISSCNATSNHPQACAVAGMDACDREFAASVFMQGLQFMMADTPAPRRERLREEIPMDGGDRVLRRAEVHER